MGPTADQLRIKSLLTETITLLCKNGLHFQSEFSIEGLLGITVDKDNVFLININETVNLNRIELHSRAVKSVLAPSHEALSEMSQNDDNQRKSRRTLPNVRSDSKEASDCVRTSKADFSSECSPRKRKSCANHSSSICSDFPTEQTPNWSSSDNEAGTSEKSNAASHLRDTAEVQCVVKDVTNVKPRRKRQALHCTTDSHKPDSSFESNSVNVDKPLEVISVKEESLSDTDFDPADNPQQSRNSSLMSPFNQPFASQDHDMSAFYGSMSDAGGSFWDSSQTAGCDPAQDTNENPPPTLNSSEKIASGPKNVCEVCGIPFKLNRDLNAHMLRVHNTGNRFQCLFCGMVFNYKHNLKTHMKKQHKDFQ